LNKYCKFLPVEIKFGTKTEKQPAEEGEEAVELVSDNIINNPNPAWTKSPSSLEEEDYKGFYRELYPMNFEDPLFHIHLNVDYPFNLTGILYFPKLKKNMEIQKNKIQLYCNQVFVTDSVEGIVPDFLTLLHGVIDSPDIPLNVSRSYLQSDHNVKKISSHIGKKVADKLEELFKKDRTSYEEKWEDINVIIEYGMITDDKFFKRSEKFALFGNVDGEFATLNEYKEKISALQTDKDGKLVVLYASNKDTQYSYIAEAKEKGYDVLLMDSPIVGHLLQKLESQGDNINFVRVDADTVDNLIKKEGEVTSILSEDEQKTIQEYIESQVNKESFTVQFEARDSAASPFVITQTEFMRRMKEMSATGGGGGMMFGSLPDSYNLVVNSNHSLAQKILNESDEALRNDIIREAYDLARLSQNLLTGEELSNFIRKGYSKLA
jgi:molecular chaperone HtpG